MPRPAHQILLYDAEWVPIQQACIEFDRMGIRRGQGRKTFPHDVIHALLAERECILLGPDEQPMNDHQRQRVDLIFTALRAKIRAGVLTSPADYELAVDARRVAPDPLWREAVRREGRSPGDPVTEGGAGR
ncbi:MAG: hypothetical protein QOE90_813 [Thermoplasmata archaeon]|jgi:hypothetical protein|nr:hypothetical protein [Thermoplasmata archaeon]